MSINLLGIVGSWAVDFADRAPGFFFIPLSYYDYIILYIPYNVNGIYSFFKVFLK